MTEHDEAQAVTDELLLRLERANDSRCRHGVHVRDWPCTHCQEGRMAEEVQ